jgi:hypothetical protein
MELHRLDRLQASLWGKAMDGDLGATTIVLKVIDQRVRLLGLQARIVSNNGDPKVLVIGPVAGDEG